MTDHKFAKARKETCGQQNQLEETIKIQKTDIQTLMSWRLAIVYGIIVCCYPLVLLIAWLID